ncbi:hypothetical protein BE11_12300 [Sorangium cellulosum]|nr:hypothetical protein BE11_12300 [Sorangium cellulosum]
MTRPVPPALAFYTRHPLDNDALGELDSKPEGIAEVDWQKWREVFALAGQQAGALVTQCRDEALEILGNKVAIGSQATPKDASKYWSSWAYVLLGKKRLKLCIGAGVGTDPEGSVWVCPYVYLAGGAARVRSFRAALDRAGIEYVQGDTTWFGAGNVPLARIVLREEGDLDEIVEESRRAFERLAPGLPQIAMHAGLGS